MKTPLSHASLMCDALFYPTLKNSSSPLRVGVSLGIHPGVAGKVPLSTSSLKTFHRVPCPVPVLPSAFRGGAAAMVSAAACLSPRLFASSDEFVDVFVEADSAE